MTSQTAIEQSHLLAFRPAIRAPRDEVFAAFTDSRELQAAFGEAEADMRSGGYLLWRDPFEASLVGGRILEFEPSKRFAMAEEVSGGHFVYEFHDRPDRTIAAVKFYAPGPQPRALLDSLLRRTAFHLAGVTARWSAESGSVPSSGRPRTLRRRRDHESRGEPTSRGSRSRTRTIPKLWESMPI